MRASFSRSKLRALSLLLAVFWLPAGAWAIGAKKVVAVQSFDNKAGSSQWTTGRYLDLGDAMADQLTDALIQSGQFVVLERIGLQAVVAEQDLARSGRFQPSKSARTGKLTSAQILVQGVISEIERSASKGAGSFSFGGIKLKGDSQEVHLGLIIRLVDTTTGQVIDSQRVEARAAQGGVRANINVEGFDVGTNSTSSTPIGKAVQLAIDDAVEYIAERLRDVPYRGRVVKVKDDVVYLSAGANHGVSEDDVFSVYSVGEELIDPETGLNLGSDEELIGRAVVFSVHDKYSKARLPAETEAKPGDTIRSDVAGM